MHTENVHLEIPKGMIMKRILTALFILTASVSAFSLGVSVGIGASGAYSWETTTSTTAGTTQTDTTYEVPLNFKAFIDVTYFEVSGGYMMRNGTSTKSDITGSPSSTSTSSDKKGWITAALLAKIPIKLGSVKLFPLVGVEYYKNLSYTDANGNDLKAALPADQQANLDQFWISAGIGADISLGKIIYIRPEVMIGYKLLSKYENDHIDFLKSGGATTVSTIPLAVSGRLLLGFKL
jgi:hypothetical protein